MVEKFTKKKSVIWISANKFGYEMLKHAIKTPGFDLQVIVTLAEDSSTVMYDGVDKSLWKEFGVRVMEVCRIEELPVLLAGEIPDIGIVCGWRQIIPPAILRIPQEGFVGFHPSLLPYGRGSAPIINTILLGLKESGVSMYYLAEGIDDGDVIGQKHFSVSLRDYAEDVYNKVIQAGADLVDEFMPGIIQGTAPRILQDSADAFEFPKLTLQDNEVDFSRDSLDLIDRKIRAFSRPYRGAFVCCGKKKLILWESELVSE